MFAVWAGFSNRPCSPSPLPSRTGHSAGVEGEGSGPLQPRAGECVPATSIPSICPLPLLLPKMICTLRPLPASPSSECTFSRKLFLMILVYNPKILMCWGSLYFILFYLFAYLLIAFPRCLSLLSNLSNIVPWSKVQRTQKCRR